jgi:hypothetical protein
MQVETLARQMLKNPIEIQVGGRSVVNSDITQVGHFCAHICVEMPPAPQSMAPIQAQMSRAAFTYAPRVGVALQCAP